jgi:glycosyltransferase involved in cell wall biosynthesis
VPGVTVKLGVIALAGPGNGGTYQYTLAMLHGLQHVRGFDITLFGDPANPDFVKLGYPIRSLVESNRKQLTALAFDRMRLPLPDPFASQDIVLSPIYSLALLHTDKPYAYTLHDLQQLHFPEHFSALQRVWRHQIHSRLLARAGRVICESRYVKSDIVRSFGVSEKRIAVIAAPPQRQFLTLQGDEQLRAARGRLGLPERFVIYPAHYWPHKNHLRLLEAFRLVVNEEPDLKLVLTGQTQPTPAQLKKLYKSATRKMDDYQTVVNAIDRLRLNEQVVHLGFIDRGDLQATYQLASALVMPSLFESVSIPIYEAFWTGTPVVASNILGIPEQVGDAGVLFDPTSVPSIRDAILKTVRDVEGARRRAQRGREKMLSMTPERYGDQLQRLLDELVPGRTAGQNASGISGKPS